MKVQVNDIVQIVPGHEWAGCLLIVAELKGTSILGFVQIPLKGEAFIRVEKKDFKKVGTALHVPVR